jgi:hypothetical protein
MYHLVEADGTEEPMPGALHIVPFIRAWKVLPEEPQPTRPPTRHSVRHEVGSKSNKSKLPPKNQRKAETVDTHMQRERIPSLALVHGEPVRLAFKVRNIMNEWDQRQCEQLTRTHGAMILFVAKLRPSFSNLRAFEAISCSSCAVQ